MIEHEGMVSAPRRANRVQLRGQDPAHLEYHLGRLPCKYERRVVDSVVTEPCSLAPPRRWPHRLLLAPGGIRTWNFISGNGKAILVGHTLWVSGQSSRSPTLHGHNVPRRLERTSSDCEVVITGHTTLGVTSAIALPGGRFIPRDYYQVGLDCNRLRSTVKEGFGSD